MNKSILCPAKRDEVIGLHGKHSNWPVLSHLCYSAAARSSTPSRYFRTNAFQAVCYGLARAFEASSLRTSAKPCFTSPRSADKSTLRA
eukprot:5384891-Pleurochrysis_carterae.AAC.3